MQGFSSHSDDSMLSSSLSYLASPIQLEYELTKTCN